MRFNKPIKGFCNYAIVLNKFIIKVIKSKERLYSFYYIRFNLIINNLCFFRVDFNAFNTYNKA